MSPLAGPLPLDSPARSQFAPEPASPTHSTANSTADSIDPPISDVISLESLSEHADSSFDDDDRTSEVESLIGFEMVRSHDFSVISGHSATRTSSDTSSKQHGMSLSFPDPLAPASESSASDIATRVDDSSESGFLLLDAHPAQLATPETTPEAEPKPSSVDKDSAIASWLENTQQSRPNVDPVGDAVSFWPKATSTAADSDGDSVSTHSLFSKASHLSSARPTQAGSSEQLHVTFVGGSIAERDNVLKRLGDLQDVTVAVAPVDSCLSPRLVVHFIDDNVRLTSSLKLSLSSSSNVILRVRSGESSLPSSLVSLPSASSSMTIRASACGTHLQVNDQLSRDPIVTVARLALMSKAKLRVIVSRAIIKEPQAKVATPASDFLVHLLVGVLGSVLLATFAINLVPRSGHRVANELGKSTQVQMARATPPLSLPAATLVKMGLLDPAPVVATLPCSFSSSLSCALSIVSDVNATVASPPSNPERSTNSRPIRRKHCRQKCVSNDNDKSRRDLPWLRETIGVVGKQARARGHDVVASWKACYHGQPSTPQDVRCARRACERPATVVEKSFRCPLGKHAGPWTQATHRRHAFPERFGGATLKSTPRIKSFATSARHKLGSSNPDLLKLIKRFKMKSSRHIKKASQTARAIRQGKIDWRDIACAVQVRERDECRKLRRVKTQRLTVT
ncbi:hypothetical protein OIV83_006344 [Microbotryomycetes sp. JL201]|nr:hypothetical protein OIV83_006344 [Microbotryomycetes sp. JL201]